MDAGNVLVQMLRCVRLGFAFLMMRGRVKLEIIAAPEAVTDCNCSVCRRYGVLGAYYAPAHVRINAMEGATEGYLWGDKSIEFTVARTAAASPTGRPWISMLTAWA